MASLTLLVRPRSWLLRRNIHRRAGGQSLLQLVQHHQHQQQQQQQQQLDHQARSLSMFTVCRTGGMSTTTTTATTFSSTPIHYCRPLHPYGTTGTGCFLSSQAANPKQKKKKKKASTDKNNGSSSLGSKKKNKKNKRALAKENRRTKEGGFVKYAGFKHLHPAAKMKRILSFADDCFSADYILSCQDQGNNNNRQNRDENRRPGNRSRRKFGHQIESHKGWCRLDTLLGQPVFRGWATKPLAMEAFQQTSRFKVERRHHPQKSQQPQPQPQSQQPDQSEPPQLDTDTATTTTTTTPTLAVKSDYWVTRKDVLLNLERAKALQQAGNWHDDPDYDDFNNDYYAGEQDDDDDNDDDDDDDDNVDPEEIPIFTSKEEMNAYFDSLDHKIDDKYAWFYEEEEEEEESEESSDEDNFNNDNFNFNNDNNDNQKDNLDAPAPKKRKNSQLPNYNDHRELVVLRTHQQLQKKIADICERLSQSKAIGLDVEYATLERNISPNLPAVLQLAGDDLTVVLWLDKFDDHGRSMFTTQQQSCAPLFQLFQSTKIAKVGIGIFHDVKNLAAWWNMTSTKCTRVELEYFFSHLIDLNEDIELIGSTTTSSSSLDERSLQHLCAHVLQRHLPKKKQKHKRDKKHWRSRELDHLMVTYAAHDASCTLDIYHSLQAKADK